MMTNAVAEICRQAGLTSASAVAKLIGIEQNDAVDLLAVLPPRQVQSAMRLLAEVGASLRLPLKPFSFWLDRANLDALYSNNVCRDDLGLVRCPRTRGHFSEIVRELRRTMTFAQIAARFNRDMIPRHTPTEIAAWTAKSVDRCATTARRGWVIEPAPADLSRWRDAVVDVVLSRCCPQDPAASVRWGFSWSDADGQVTVTTQPMPTGPRRWISTWLMDRRWLDGKWGVGPKTQS